MISQIADKIGGLTIAIVILIIIVGVVYCGLRLAIEDFEHTKNED